jgi:hypothetical protein
VDACNPLLQAHPTWARDEHEGRGISTSLSPISGHLTFPLSRSASCRPIWAGARGDISLVGLGTPSVSKRRQVVLPSGGGSGRICVAAAESSPPSPGARSRPSEARRQRDLSSDARRGGFAVPAWCSRSRAWTRRLCALPFRPSLQALRLPKN